MNVTRDLSDPRRVMVAIANPATIAPLLDLAAVLAAGPDDEVIAAHVVTVPHQMMLSSARSSPEVARGTALLRQALDAGAAAGLPVHGLVNLSRSISEGLAAAVEKRHADVLLLGWSDSGSPTAHAELAAFDRLMHRVASAVSCDLLVGKFRNAGRDRVLVPIAASRHLALVARTVRALAAAGSEILFLHVVAADATRDAAHDAVVALLEQHDLGDLGTLEIEVADDVTAAVLARTCGVDVAVIGAVAKAALAEALFGSKAEAIAAGADCSVLVARAGA